MKRSIVIALAILAALAAGFTLVVTHRAGSGPTPAAAPTALGMDIGTETQSQAVETAEPLPSQATGLEGLSKAQLQQLIVAAGQDAIKRAIEAAGPAVVQITVTMEQRFYNPFEQFFNDPFFKRFFGEPPLPQKHIARALGSGFFFDYQGKRYLLRIRYRLKIWNLRCWPELTIILIRSFGSMQGFHIPWQEYGSHITVRSRCMILTRGTCKSPANTIM